MNALDHAAALRNLHHSLSWGTPATASAPSAAAPFLQPAEPNARQTVPARNGAVRSSNNPQTYRDDGGESTQSGGALLSFARMPPMMPRQ